MIHYGRFFVVFGRHFSRLLINSTIMEGWECRSICSRDSQKFADCATSPLPAILGVILLEIKVSCTADALADSKGDSVPLRYLGSSGETSGDIPLSSARQTRPCNGARAVEKKSGRAGLFQEIESAYCGTPLPALARTAGKRHTVWCAFLYALVYVLLISQMIIPSQWSISCWIICAVQPVKVFSLVWNFSFWYCTLMDCQRRVLRVPVSDRQPSSAS